MEPTWQNSRSGKRSATFCGGERIGGLIMTALDALQSVQFVTVNGRRLAVLNAEDWENMVEWLETLEDVVIAKDACRALQTANGNRQHAGWLRWDDVKEEIE
jgi:hypothetical protein